MRLTLNGMISISVEDESLFDGQPLPVSFVCDLTEETVTFENGKVKMNFSVPVELCISDDEWSRAVGEVLARALQVAQ
jgi:hypothetical protein